MTKYKKKRLSTYLIDLYGKDYSSHIEVDREYWYFFGYDSEVFRKIGNAWNKIKITYLRSGCAFYVFSDVPELGENFFPIKCFMASQLVFAEIDPYKDLKGFDGELYYFDTEHTIVHNFPNEPTIELDENLVNQLEIKWQLLTKLT